MPPGIFLLSPPHPPFVARSPCRHVPRLRGIPHPSVSARRHLHPLGRQGFVDPGFRGAGSYGWGGFGESGCSEEAVEFSFEGGVCEGLKGINAPAPFGKQRSPGSGFVHTTVPLGTPFSRSSITCAFYCCCDVSAWLLSRFLIDCGKPRTKPICAPRLYIQWSGGHSGKSESFCFGLKEESVFVGCCVGCLVIFVFVVLLIP